MEEDVDIALLQNEHQDDNVENNEEMDAEEPEVVRFKKVIGKTFIVRVNQLEGLEEVLPKSNPFL